MVALVAAAAGLGACGVTVGGGEDQHVGLLVTQDFGRVPVGPGSETVEAPSSDTVLRLLERSRKVTTRFGGGFVQSIEGIEGGQEKGRPVDWFFYVNGQLEDQSAAAVKLHRGDQVWWDRHDWGTTPDVKTVVGSFPEPFIHGSDGKRYPVRLECADDAKAACDKATAQLNAAGAKVVARARLGTVGGEETLRVLVGRWSAIRADYAARQVERGPKASGVYAKPAPDGTSVALLDLHGKTVRSAGAGTGFVLATKYMDEQPTWMITGTDEAGVDQAAAALTEDALRRKFAVAIADSVPTALPIAP